MSVASLRTTAMIALVCGLATLSIGAVMQRMPAKPRAANPVPAKMEPAEAVSDPMDFLASRHLAMPVKGFDRVNLHDTFDDMRVGHRHEALDIMAARGTPVVAADDGTVARLFRSVAGGITIYQRDPSGRFIYYYAHLDRYAEGLREGTEVKRGDVIGYVGSTGNAPANAPHLHFTIFLMGPEKQWWRGKAVNPFPYLTASR